MMVLVSPLPTLTLYLIKTHALFAHTCRRKKTLLFSSVVFACLFASRGKYSSLMIAALFDLSDHPKATFDPLPPGVG
jgi:hypothetical protein